MTEGREVKILGGEDCDPLLAFDESFKYLSSKSQDDGVLILTYNFSSEALKFKSKIKCNCNDRSILRIAFAFLLQKVGRDQPLFHFENFTSGREQVKMHITNPKPKQDLVFDWSLANGYEAEKVIHCSKSKRQISRASMEGVILRYDEKLFASYGFEWLKNNPDHICGELPKLE